jgi:prophage antirepressor-like protein
MLEYTNEEFGRIRVELITSKTYFYAADVCRILGKGTWTGTYTQRYAGKEHIKQIKNGLKKANLIDFDGVMNLCEKAQAKTSNLLMSVAERINYNVMFLEESFTGTRYLPFCKDEQQGYENGAGDFKVFYHPIFWKVRAMLIGENVYFYATDICNALGFKRYGSTYANRYAGEENLKQIVHESMRGMRCINVINVAGISNLCKRSKLEEESLSNFQEWVDIMCNAMKPQAEEKPVEEKPLEIEANEHSDNTSIPLAKANSYTAKEPILMEEVKQELEEHEEVKEEETMESNAMKIFSNPEFGDIRTEVINGEPWFCLSDVCKALELEQVSRVKARLNSAGVTTSKVGVQTGLKADGTPSIQIVSMSFVNEANLYKTIFQSRKESAERFTDWVAGEVLPSIRKTGSYQQTPPLTAAEQIQLIAKGCVELTQQVATLGAEVTELKTDMPLYGCEIDEVQQHVKRKGVQCLGGKDSEAYADGSIRSQVYKDIYSQLKREYGCVSTYKSIKRKYIADVHDFIDCYQLPTVLEEQITAANAQQRLF